LYGYDPLAGGWHKGMTDNKFIYDEICYDFVNSIA
jgi:hypothetical protein